MEGQANIIMVDSHKLSFRPLCLKFNKENERFLAIAGTKQVEVVTLSSKGKVATKLSVDLMLEAFGKDLSITNIAWLPSSQTMLAVATHQFVRIYDLASDNISPKFNLMQFEGVITDFTFTKAQVSHQNLSSFTTYIVVSSSNGRIYYHQIQYQAHGLKEGQENNQDDSQIILANYLQFADNIDTTTSCLSIFYSDSLESLFLTFQGGNCYLAKVDLNNLGALLSVLVLSNISDKTSGQTHKTIWQKNGENIVALKDVGSVSLGSGNQAHYLTGFSRKPGSNTGLPLLIRISNNQVDVNLLKPGNVSNSVTTFSSANGVAYVKNSIRSSKLMRLVCLYDDGFTQSSHIPSLFAKDISHAEPEKQYFKS
mmetsp:Transcript_44131/g.42835  ORF Transcript_44131/g.42835 Transcript_44131/m.42835 type:complete len:368 (-) Transcript_44131:189-1292(-)